MELISMQLLETVSPQSIKDVLTSGVAGKLSSIIPRYLRVTIGEVGSIAGKP